MFGSHLVRYEAEKTKDEIRRGYLIIDANALENVPNDQQLLGFNIQISQYTCINSPIISDVPDETIRAELMKRGLKQRDASASWTPESGYCSQISCAFEETEMNIKSITVIITFRH